MLKWKGDKAHAWIHDMFNYSLQHGMPYGWTQNSIKPLHKDGDVNNVIMIKPSWSAP